MCSKVRLFSESARKNQKSVPNTLKVHIYLYHWAVQASIDPRLNSFRLWNALRPTAELPTDGSDG